MNWQKALKDGWTTLAGILSALASFVLFSAMLFPEWVAWPKWAVALAMFALMGGLAQLGITAKSFKAEDVPVFPKLPKQ